jgi:hypothetical protein
LPLVASIYSWLSGITAGTECHCVVAMWVKDTRGQPTRKAEMFRRFLPFTTLILGLDMNWSSLCGVLPTRRYVRIVGVKTDFPYALLASISPGAASSEIRVYMTLSLLVPVSSSRLRQCMRVLPGARDPMLILLATSLGLRWGVWVGT